MPVAFAFAAGLALAVVDVDTLRVGPAETVETAGARLRLAGIDGPERGDHCPNAARIRAGGAGALAAILAAAERVEVVFVGHGRYRPLVRVLADGEDVAEALIAAGWARPYGPGRRPWCPTGSAALD